MLLRNLQGGHFYWDTVYIHNEETGYQEIYRGDNPAMKTQVLWVRLKNES